MSQPACCCCCHGMPRGQAGCVYASMPMSAEYCRPPMCRVAVMNTCFPASALPPDPCPEGATCKSRSLDIPWDNKEHSEQCPIQGHPKCEVWDVRSKHRILQFSVAPDSRMLSWSPDCALLCFATGVGRQTGPHALLLHDAGTGAALATFSSESEVKSVTWHPSCLKLLVERRSSHGSDQARLICFADDEPTRAPCLPS